MDDEKLAEVAEAGKKKEEETLSKRKRFKLTPENRKRIYEFLIILAVVFVVSVLIVMYYQAELQKAIQEKPTSTVTFFSHRDEGKTVFVEVAATELEQAKGLMNRTYLPHDQGMLFVFQGNEVRYFWMKSTLIPLDMIFVSSDRKIMYIRDNVQPCYTESCPAYDSMYPVKYVIEVNGGFCRENQIYEGQYVEINI